MSKESKMNVSIENNEEVSIVRRKVYSYKNMPKYRRIGIMDNDLLDVLGEVSKPAYRMFLVLKNIRSDTTNIATLAPGKDQVEVTMQTKALRELASKGLIHKIKTQQLHTREGLQLTVPKRSYLINPMYLFPKGNDDFERSLFYWNQLVK